MNNVDIIILFVVAVSALISLNRGFIREVLSITGWIIGAIFVVTFLPILSPFVKDYIKDENWVKITTAGVIFVAFMVFWIFFSSSIASKIKSSKLGTIDNTLGLFFGLARAFLLVILTFILVNWIAPKEKQSEAFKESKYFQMAGSFAKPIEELIPKSTLKMIEEKTKDSKEEIEDTAKEKTEDAKDKIVENTEKNMDFIGELLEPKVDALKEKINDEPKKDLEELVKELTKE